MNQIKWLVIIKMSEFDDTWKDVQSCTQKRAKIKDLSLEASAVYGHALSYTSTKLSQ